MAGRRGDLRVADGGNGRAGGARRGGFGGVRGNLRAFGRRTAGGSGRGRAKKPHTRGFRGSRGCARAPGSRAKPGPAWASSGRAPGKKTGGAGAKRGVRAGKRRGWRALGAQKAPFLPQTGRAAGCAGGKLAGKAGGVCRVIGSCAGNLQAVSADKAGGFEKLFPRAYRKELPRALLLCRWRTVIGADNLVVPSGCYLGRKE